MSNAQPSPEEILAAILCCIHAQGRREVAERGRVASPRPPTAEEIGRKLAERHAPEMLAMVAYAGEIVENLSVDLLARQGPTQAFGGFVGSVKRETDRIEDAIGSIVGLPQQRSNRR